MMINTIFPNVLHNPATICKTYILPIIFNNNCVSGKALTLNEIEKLGNYLDRKITNINICKCLICFNEYLTIIS